MPINPNELLVQRLYRAATYNNFELVGAFLNSIGFVQIENKTPEGEILTYSDGNLNIEFLANPLATEMYDEWGIDEDSGPWIIDRMIRLLGSNVCMYEKKHTGILYKGSIKSSGQPAAVLDIKGKKSRSIKRRTVFECLVANYMD